MSFVNRISDFLVSKIIKFHIGDSDSDEKVEVLRYGTYVIVSDLLKNLVLFLMAYYLGIFAYTLFAYICTGLLKSFVGGVHSNSFWGCLTTSTSLLLSLTYVSTYIINNPNIYFFVSGFIISILIYYRYAPADHINKPIKSKKQIRKFRIIIFSISSIYFLTALYFYNTPYSNIMILSLLVNAVTILPIVYKITGNKTSEFYRMNPGQQ